MKPFEFKFVADLVSGFTGKCRVAGEIRDTYLIDKDVKINLSCNVDYQLLNSFAIVYGNWNGQSLLVEFIKYVGEDEFRLHLAETLQRRSDGKRVEKVTSSPWIAAKYSNIPFTFSSTKDLTECNLPAVEPPVHQQPQVSLESLESQIETILADHPSGLSFDNIATKVNSDSSTILDALEELQMNCILYQSNSKYILL